MCECGHRVVDQALRLYSEPKRVCMNAAVDGFRFRSPFKAEEVAIKLNQERVGTSGSCVCP